MISHVQMPVLNPLRPGFLDYFPAVKTTFLDRSVPSCLYLLVVVFAVGNQKCGCLVYLKVEKQLQQTVVESFYFECLDLLGRTETVMRHRASPLLELGRR